VSSADPTLENLYQDVIMDHYRNPRSKGLRDPYDVEVHHVNPTCGDEVTLRVRIADGVVQDVSYDAQGCSISQASTSVLAEQVIGVDLATAMVAEAEFLRMMQGKGHADVDEDILGDGVALAGVARFPARIKCALLGWLAFKDAAVQATASQREPSQHKQPENQHDSRTDEQEDAR
jgi:nitrogen fixation NifU-like protein